MQKNLITLLGISTLSIATPGCQVCYDIFGIPKDMESPGMVSALDDVGKKVNIELKQQDTVRFGQYTMTRDTFDFIDNATHSKIGPHGFEEYIHFFESTDKNKDNKITLSEAYEGIQDMAALSSGINK